MGSAKQFAAHIYNLQGMDANASLAKLPRFISFLVKLDRLTIGLILRSKLVFLIISSCMKCAELDRLACGFAFRRKLHAVQHSAECVDIDNESNQVP
jgi:hypothetical protein